MRTIPGLHDFSGTLSPPVREALQRRCSTRQVARNEMLYRQGDPATAMFQVVEGDIKLCNHTVDGREHVVQILRPGDWVGEMGVIDGMPRLGDAIAVTDVVLRVLSKRDFDALRAEHPEFGQALMLLLCRRLRLAYMLHSEASELPVSQRLVRLILRLAYSHGSTPEENQRTIDISQEEIGRMLNVSRQSVSKELKQLVADGIIELKYGQTRVLDLKALHARQEGSGTEQIAAVYEDPLRKT